MRICAWCKSLLTSSDPSRERLRSDSPVSHGICPSCMAAQLANADRPAAQQ